MTKIRITYRTVFEPLTKYPIKSFEVYPGGMYVNFRKKQDAIDMFKKIKLASKGSAVTHYTTLFRTKIYVDPISFFKKATGSIMISSGGLEAAAELLYRCISRKTYNNLLVAIQMRSWRTPARWSYDSQEDFERINGNVITHYFKKSYP